MSDARRPVDAAGVSVMVLLCLIWGVGHVAAKFTGQGISLVFQSGLRSLVAAVLFAAEVHARAAVVLVHSFDDGHAWFDDFAGFARHVEAEPRIGAVVRASLSTEVPLYLGWVTGDKRFTTVDIPAAV